MADPMLRLAQAMQRLEVASYVVHRAPAGAEAGLTALRPGVQALTVDAIERIFKQGRTRGDTSPTEDNAGEWVRIDYLRSMCVRGLPADSARYVK
jgi:hypothetical protein